MAIAVEARLSYAKICRDMGNFDKAIEIYLQACGTSRWDLGARVGLADTYRKMGRLSEATDEYEIVMQKYPRSAPARNEWAATKIVQGRCEEALRKLPNSTCHLQVPAPEGAG
jgi:tetratricopeptide (TPR) repeat protein